MIKTAWITGAGKGIGRAVALRLAKDGVCVAVSARTREDLESLAGDARDLPGAIYVFPLDVTEEETVHNTVYEIEKTLGPLDLVILNAGTHGPTSVEHFEPSVFQRLLTINVMGVVNGLAAVLPQLIEQKAAMLLWFHPLLGIVDYRAHLHMGPAKPLSLICARRLSLNSIAIM